MNIGVLNIGTGSLSSIKTKIITLGHEFVEISSPSELASVNRLILPGVGSFEYAANNINYFFSDNLLNQYLSDSQNKILGICLGMQILFNRSDESSTLCKGLSLLNANIQRITSSPPARIPHIGWSSINIQQEGTFLSKSMNGADFYFVHSYALLNSESNRHLFDEYSLSSNGNCSFISSFRFRNLYGCQFHPEKSSLAGSAFLLKFIES